MCRPFARLLRGLPVQHAGSRSGPRVRHPSLLKISDRSVANIRSPAPVLGHVRHAALPSLRFSYRGVASFAHFSTTSLNLVVPSLQTYPQFLERDTRRQLHTAVAMVVDANDTDAKPADILNEDVAMPTGRAEASLDPESDEDVPVEAEELKEALGRPPPVNSSYLPLPWKGRLGYVSCTYCTYSMQRSTVRILTYQGLSKHILALLDSSRFLFPHMSHCLYPGEPTSSTGPRSACASDQEPSRPRSTSRCGAWASIC